jgi:hypothetical protein
MRRGVFWRPNLASAAHLASSPCNHSHSARCGHRRDVLYIAGGQRQLARLIERDAFVARYQVLLAAGLVANPPPARRLHQRGRVKQSPARDLLERLRLGQDEVLAFLDDVSISFDSNQAERDQGVALLAALQTRFSGQLLFPAFA